MPFVLSSCTVWMAHMYVRHLHNSQDHHKDDPYLPLYLSVCIHAQHTPTDLSISIFAEVGNLQPSHSSREG